jgi:DNA topoisomerase-2
VVDSLMSDPHTQHDAVVFIRAVCLQHDAEPCSWQELILFSRADLERSIPSVVDGLKPGQRKILYCCFKRNLKKDIKVCSTSQCSTHV